MLTAQDELSDYMKQPAGSSILETWTTPGIQALELQAENGKAGIKEIFDILFHLSVHKRCLRLIM